MIEIRPYAGVGPVRFGMSPTETVEHLGQPQAVSTNRSSETVQRYPTMLLTYDAEGLAEVGMFPESEARLGSLDPLTRQGFAGLIAEDGEAQGVLGFVVLLNLGITVTGVHDDDQGQRAVTAFRKGRWDRVRASMKPFSL
jgi:hypothetical protein